MEPERKIEKWLRAYAKKRRAAAGDPLTLHPATRRLLQGEVARRARPPATGGEGNWFTLLLATFRRRSVLAVSIVAVVFIGAWLLLPTLNSSKQRSLSLGAMSNLRQIGTATRQYAVENKDVLPASLDELSNQLVTRQVLTDSTTGLPFVYVAGGKRLDSLPSNTVLAYSPTDKNGRAVLFADGRVETVTVDSFSGLTGQPPVELALAGKAARERPATPPPLQPAAAPAPVALAGSAGSMAPVVPAAPAVSAAPAGTTPPVGESLAFGRLVTAAEADKAKAGTREPAAGTGGELALQKTEAARSEAKKLGELETPALRLGASLVATNGLSAAETAKNSFAANAPAAQQFVQTGNAASAQNRFKNYIAPAKVPVLVNFEVQQNGDAVSVVDQDGSVYNGSVQLRDVAAQNTKEAAVARRQTEINTATVNNEQQARQNYSFRVAGMNRTLKQNVVFTGNLETISNAASAPQRAFNGGFGAGGGGGGGNIAGNLKQQAPAGAPAQWQWSNSRIVGTAVIDNTNQIEINAVPDTP